MWNTHTLCLEYIQSELIKIWNCSACQISLCQSLCNCRASCHQWIPSALEKLLLTQGLAYIMSLPWVTADLTMPPTLNTSGNAGNSVISLHLWAVLSIRANGTRKKEEGKDIHVLFLGLFLTWKTIKWIFKIESQVPDRLFLYVAFSSRCNLIKNEVFINLVFVSNIINAC